MTVKFAYKMAQNVTENVRRQKTKHTNYSIFGLLQLQPMCHSVFHPQDWLNKFMEIASSSSQYETKIAPKRIMGDNRMKNYH